MPWTFTPATASDLHAIFAGNSVGGHILAPGDTVQLQDGVTYDGAFQVRVSGTAGNPITITRSGALPPPGLDMRLSADQAQFLAAMVNAPRVQVTASTYPALQIVEGINYIEVIGVDLYINQVATSGFNTRAVTVGYQLDANTLTPNTAIWPTGCRFDRCRVHGTLTGDCTYAFLVASRALTITGCYIDEIHGVGQESKGFLSIGLGPHTMTNNYWSVASITVLYGGSGSGVPNLVPTGITFTGNYVTKKLSWKADDPSYAGIPWNVKNLFELKNAQDVYVAGNIFEHCWAMGQRGVAIVLTPQNQATTEPWTVIQRVLFENNVVRGANEGFSYNGHDQFGLPSQTSNNVIFRNNLFYDIDGTRWGVGSPIGRLCLIAAEPADFSFIHNTVHNTGTMGVAFGSPLGGGVYQKIGLLVWKNNFFCGQLYPIFGDDDGINQPAFTSYVTTLDWHQNVVGVTDAQFNIPVDTQMIQQAVWNAQFVDPGSGDYTVVPGSIYKAGGSFDATDGSDIGVDMALIGFIEDGGGPPPPPLDTVAPVTASVTAPADGAVLAGGSVPTPSGQCADNVGGGGLNANSTTFTLKRNVDNRYWDGSSWQVAVFNRPTTHLATSSGDAATWTASGGLPNWGSQSEQNGTYTLQAKATDRAGNVFTGAAIIWRLDNPVQDLTPPVVSLTTPSQGSTISDTTPTFSGVAGILTGDLATVTVRVYSGTSIAGTLLHSLQTTRNGTTGAYSVDSPLLSNGTYTARASQSDSSGNTGNSSAVTFTIDQDTTAPILTLTSPVHGSTTSDKTPSLSGVAGTQPGDSAQVVVRIYSGAGTSGTLLQTRNTNRGIGGTYSVNAQNLANGTYTAQASQVDAQGNVGLSTANTFTVSAGGGGGGRPPRPKGWGFRALASASGTTGLTILKPTGTIDDDILIMGLCHKGAGYATVPAGWTLVAQDISGSTRGEMYWKRASGEGASYAITGLADTATGFIKCYDGGLLSGNVVAVSTTQVNASGAVGIGSLTTTDPHLLMIGMVAAGGNFSVSQFGTRYSFTSGNLLKDPDLAGMFERVDFGTTNGTDCRIAAYDAVKIVPGVTGDITWVQTAVENVGIMAAFIPETTAITGTRYYLASKLPGSVINGEPQGDWDITFVGPIGWSPTQQTWQLSQLRSDAGRLTNHSVTTNFPAPHDVFFARWMTPPLEAQTIDGTLDLTAAVQAAYTATPPGATIQARYKIHVYITIGETASVRTTLINQYIDSVDFPSTQTFRALAAPQALGTNDCEAGDCIMVEIGARVLAITTPVPTNPPSEWGLVRMARGATNASASDSAGVGALNGVAGVAGSTGSAGYLDFSMSLQEQDLSAEPINDSCANAIDIASLPTVEIADTTNSLELGRGVWYTYTATFTGHLLVHAWGSNFLAEIRGFTGSCGALVEMANNDITAGIYRSDRLSPHRCASMAYLWVDSGTTYFIRVNSQRDLSSAASCGGALAVSFIQRDIVPQADDLYLPCGHVTVWRDGQLINLTPDLYTNAPSGVAIDFTRRPMDDLNTPGVPHEGVRLLVGLHEIVDIVVLDAATLNVAELEIDDIATPLSGNQNEATLVCTLAGGQLYSGWFGDGYLAVADNAHSYLNSLSTPPSFDIRGIDATHGDNQSGAPWPPADSFAVTPEESGSPYLAMDEATGVMYYTSAGEYLPLGGQTIKRFDVIGNAQLPDFATVPAGTGRNPGLKGMTVLPSGGLLVANASVINRLDATGTVIQSFTPLPPVETLTDVKVVAAGDAFWCVDLDSAALYKFDLVTGAQLAYVPTYLPIGSLTQMVLYLPTGITPVPPGFTVESCPIDFPTDLNAGGESCPAPTFNAVG